MSRKGFAFERSARLRTVVSGGESMSPSFPDVSMERIGMREAIILPKCALSCSQSEMRPSMAGLG